MSDILEQLKNSANAIKEVSLNDVTIGLRILNEQDYLDASLAVNALMKAKDVIFGPETAEMFEDEKTCQLLLRAVVDPETQNPVTKNAKELRTILTREQRMFLTEEYLSFEKEHAPSERTMSEDEFAKLFEDVKKKPEMIDTQDLSTASLKRLITILASQPSS